MDGVGDPGLDAALDLDPIFEFVLDRVRGRDFERLRSPTLLGALDNCLVGEQETSRALALGS